MAVKRNQLDLDDLPDCLLITILSKVPLKQAICCSVLSKRWKFLWTFLPNLTFSSMDFSSSLCTSIVDNIFYRHSCSLELFEFSNTLFGYGSETICSEIKEKIYEWIQLATLKNVREINIEGSTLNYTLVEVPTSIFMCHSLRSLTLKSFLLTNIPNYFVSLAGLETLNLENVVLNDIIIEHILQLCPVLKILSIFNCQGLNRLKICSKKLVSLHLSSQSWMETITVNCPKLLDLVLISVMVDMKFYLPACLNLCIKAAQFRMFTAVKSVRKITLVDLIDKDDVPILSEFPNLEQLCVGSNPISALESLLRPNVVVPEISPSSSLINLKQIHLDMTLFWNAIPLITYLVPRTPALKSLLISGEKWFYGTRARRFVNRLTNLHLPSTETKIILSQDALKEGRCKNCKLKEFLNI